MTHPADSELDPRARFSVPIPDGRIGAPPPAVSNESADESHQLEDQPARQRIGTALDETLFVEAGAGSGKTRSLVGRVRALIRSGVPIRHIAAVTFTEKAGAELRDRLRTAFEKQLNRSDDAGERQRAEEALDDLDGAAIGTLHSFAQRILTEHPIEAGIPPLVEVLDEVASGVAFEERWQQEFRVLLDDDALAEPLLLGLATGVKLDHLRSLAKQFNANWDLLEERVLAGPEPAPPPVPDVGELVDEARRLAAMAEHCANGNDRLLARLPEVRAWADRLASAPSAPTRLELLRYPPKPWHLGSKGNWACDLPALKAEGKALVSRAEDIVCRVQDAVLRILARWVARITLDAAEARRRDGRFEFHDLLVLSRELLRDHALVRKALSERYERLLLDEFQDSDPIQIELAVRIAGGEAASAERWEDVVVPPGRLFVVGDPKQSIYRFRRASIATYLDAQQRIGSLVQLTTNFRTVAPILDWVNVVFEQLIRPEPGSQPTYQPLTAYRGAVPGGPPVVILGATAHDTKLTADVLRVHEASDVAAVIKQARAERWQVCDERTAEWRDIELDDIAVLIPARTSLPQLEDALDAAGVPYRAEASSLVYQAREVRDLLAAARAIDDPSDALALVTALRSPLFGCGDDDLWTWKQADGSFNMLAPLPIETHPVAEAIAYLRDLHLQARWMAPSEVLAALIRDRRMLEAAVDGPRARDAWRRLRFVVDQARVWSEAEHGGLRGYLQWAAHQGEESSRVAESVLPETDTNTVRVMTIHAAKGLEFPMVVLSGMTSQPRRANGVQVLWPPDGGFAVRLAGGVQTGDFEAAQPVDEQMDDHERRRLLYVACTRARDHLVVSMHRSRESNADTNAMLMANAAGWAAGVHGAEPFTAKPVELVPVPVSESPPPPAWEAWVANITSVRERAARASAVSASGLEGTDPEVIAEAIDPGLAKGARDLELPPWSKGRFGTAIGRAVHGVLQSVDLASGAGLDDAVAAQVLAEGVLEHAGLVRDLVSAALASDVVRRAAVRRYWKETYVGTTLDDGSVLEGFVDLIYREDGGGLVVVDYKTDAVPVAAIDARVAIYLPQLAAYVNALEVAAAEPVARGVLIFLTPAGSVERAFSRNQLPLPPGIRRGS